MITTFKQALAVQTRRAHSGRPFFAKAVKRFLKRSSLSPGQLKDLGYQCITPRGYKRAVSEFGMPDEIDPALLKFLEPAPTE